MHTLLDDNKKTIDTLSTVVKDMKDLNVFKMQTLVKEIEDKTKRIADLEKTLQATKKVCRLSPLLGAQAEDLCRQNHQEASRQGLRHRCDHDAHPNRLAGGERLGRPDGI